MGKKDRAKREPDKYDKIMHQMERAKDAFTLSDIEYQNAGKFVEEHKCTKEEKVGYALSFIYGSGIGTKVTIKCRTCGKKEDITDYEHW